LISAASAANIESGRSSCSSSPIQHSPLIIPSAPSSSPHTPHIPSRKTTSPVERPFDGTEGRPFDGGESRGSPFCSRVSGEDDGVELDDRLLRIATGSCGSQRGGMKMDKVEAKSQNVPAVLISEESRDATKENLPPAPRVPRPPMTDKSQRSKTCRPLYSLDGSKQLLPSRNRVPLGPRSASADQVVLADADRASLTPQSTPRIRSALTPQPTGPACADFADDEITAGAAQCGMCFGRGLHRHNDRRLFCSVCHREPLPVNLFLQSSLSFTAPCTWPAFLCPALL